MVVYMFDCHKFGTISDLQYLSFNLIPFLIGGIGMVMGIRECWMEKTGSF